MGGQPRRKPKHHCDDFQTSTQNKINFGVRLEANRLFPGLIRLS